MEWGQQKEYELLIENKISTGESEQKNKLEKHSDSADLRQAALFPHTMIPTKRTVLYLFHFYEPSLKSL